MAASSHTNDNEIPTLQQNENASTSHCETINAVNEQQNQLTQSNNTSDEQQVNIIIHNVVCRFRVRCHLDLRQIALNGFNVEYRRARNKVIMKIRRPSATAHIWSSGKIVCTGTKSVEEALIASRRFARCLQNLGFEVVFSKFRILNILGVCLMPFRINIMSFAMQHRECVTYEPELNPGVSCQLLDPKATLNIHSTGSITVFARKTTNLQAAIQFIYPLVYEFRIVRKPDDHPKEQQTSIQ